MLYLFCAQNIPVPESSGKQKSSTTKFFSTVRQEKIPIENRDKPLFFCVAFFDTRSIWNTERFSNEFFFGTGRQNNFDRELCYTPPVHKSLQYPKLVKHRRVPPRSFPLLWDKGSSIWNCVIRLLCTRFLLLKTFWNTDGFSWDFSRCCETKNLRHKNVFSDSCAHNFLISEVSQTQKISPANRDIPVLCTKVSRYPKLPETLNGSPENFFGSVRQKFLRQIVLHLSCAQKCRNPDSVNFTKVPLQIFLVLWDHQISERKAWKPPFLRKNFWCS